MMNPKNPRPLVSSATERVLLGGLNLERVLVPDAVDSVLNLREIRGAVFEGARLCFYLGEACRSVCPEHQRCNEYSQLSSFLGEMIFDSGWNFCKGFSFYEM